MRLLNKSQPIHSGHPLNEAMIGCYAQLPFSYSPARIRDQLNRNDMTLDSGCSLSMLGATGRSVSFSTGTLTVPGTVFKRVDGNGRISVGLWILPTSIASYRTVFDTTNRHCSFFMNTVNDGFVGFGGTGTGMIFTSPFTVNEWQYLLVTYDGTYAKAYRNGLLVGTSTLGNTTFTDNLLFGPNPSGGGSAYQGRQSAWRLWARTFTAKQAVELYQEARKAFVNTYRYLADPSPSPSANEFSLVAGTGLYVMTGQDATLSPSFAYTLDAGTGSFSMVGSDADLVFQPAIAYVLQADTGYYVMTGQDANLTIGRHDPTQTLYLGRYRRGTLVPMIVSSSQSPLACPTVDFWRSGSLIKTIKIPGRTKLRTLFSLEQFLDATFTDGHYIAAISYNINGVITVKYRYFEVIGGSSQGNVIAVTELRRPLGRAIIAQTENGNVTMGYNPRVE